MKNSAKIICAIGLVVVMIGGAILGYNFSNIKQTANDLRENLLIAAMDPDNAPFSLYKDGIWEGIDVDLAKKIAGDENKKLEILSTDSDDILDAIKSGKADFGFGPTTTEKPDRKIASSKVYLKKNESVVVSKKADEISKSGQTNKKSTVETKVESDRTIYVSKPNKKLQITVSNIKKSDVDKIMNDKKDSDSKKEYAVNKIEAAVETEKEEEITKGEEIDFGEYEQDANEANGKEPIKWRVLDVKEGKCLIISKYVLDCDYYENDEESQKVTWEGCSLRKWLNNEFLENTFSEEEQNVISESTVIAGENDETKVDSGNDTKDKVFLLSLSEADCYFSSDSDRKAEMTEYFKQKIDYTEEDSQAGWYWLRSPGYDTNAAANINSNGEISYLGSWGFNEYGGIRPAMWIEMKKDANQNNRKKDEESKQKVEEDDANSFESDNQEDNTSDEKELTQYLELDIPNLGEWKLTSTLEDAERNGSDGVQYTITWEEVPGADGYEIEKGEMTESDGWFPYEEETESCQVGIGFSDPPSAIRAKVRAYHFVNGEKVYGPWSDYVTRDGIWDDDFYQKEW